MKILLSLSYFGSALAPQVWTLSKSINIQRLYYIKSGRGAYRMPDGRMVPFVPGWLYLYPYNLNDGFVSDPDDPIDHLFFDFLSTPPVIAPEPLVWKVEPGSLLEAQLCLLDREVRDFRQFCPHPERPGERNSPAEPIKKRRQLVETMFRALLLRMDLEQPLPFSDDEAVCQTLDSIREHYAEPVTVSGMAAASGFDVSYFIRRFKSIMGVTPYAYLRSYRLMRAEELMKDGLGAAEAAEAVGYENASSLCRALREIRKI